MIPYFLRNGYWIVGGDETRAWSSAAGTWVDRWPKDCVTRIASATDLSDVLRPYGLPLPVPSADDVRAEASRRMQVLLGARDAAHLEILISNGSREAIRLLSIQVERDWTEAEADRAAYLQQVDTAIEAIRAASNRLEAAPPDDFRADRHWVLSAN